MHLMSFRNIFVNKYQNCISNDGWLILCTARSGKPATYDTEFKLSIINEACKKPKDLGYAAEVW